MSGNPFSDPVEGINGGNSLRLNSREADRIWEKTHSFRQLDWNRHLRIAPAVHLFALLAAVVLVGFGAAKLSILISSQILICLGSSAVLLPNYRPDTWDHTRTGSMNDPLYAIPVECSFYLVAPLSLLYRTFIERGACFAIGVFWAKYRGRIPVKRWMVVPMTAQHLGMKVFADGPFYATFKPLLISIPLGYLIVVLGYMGPRILFRFTERIGDVRFAAYIWQYLVIDLVVWFGLRGGWWQALLVCAITLGVAWLSFRFIEHIVDRFKKLVLRDAMSRRTLSGAVGQPDVSRISCTARSPRSDTYRTKIYLPTPTAL
ncbi:acyltransferase family protein [Subtercola vilae]|uniref:Acyltransferase n=1 Tax=Subtercola vilae TaxID=2056433 RepID=A0A4T2C0T4_9MICO|nr:acyltransferase [Subtercola vilae]TIH35588.1 acyltransferase [Subtercola vilae]